MFEKAREKYKIGEYKILVAKMIDKYEFCIKRNKITNTDFLNISEIAILKKILEDEHIQNYIFYGVRKNADRQILIFYPEKLNKEMVEKNYSNILEIISIVLPNFLNYEHKEYLSGIMKLGIKREKFGDIVIKEKGADIICLKEVSNYLLEGLKDLTRFKSSTITRENINSFEDEEIKFEEFNIIVSSIRLDNFVSELARCSRTKAKEYIENGMVFLNSINEFKESKKLEEGDIITIRGKGKFIFDFMQNETRSGKINVKIRKYK